MNGFRNIFKNRYWQVTAVICALLYSGYGKLFADLKFEYESMGEVITLKVPRMYGQMTWGGKVVDSFKIPYANMPPIDGYSIPMQDSYNWGLLRINGINREIAEFKKISRESSFRNIYHIRKYIEIDSDVDGYDRYGPKNYREKLGGIRFYYVSDDWVITCVNKCSYKGVYKDFLTYMFSFPKSELKNLDKIDQSLKVLFDQFITN